MRQLSKKELEKCKIWLCLHYTGVNRKRGCKLQECNFRRRLPGIPGARGYARDNRQPAKAGHGARGAWHGSHGEG